MFETAEIGSKVSKADYEAQVPELRMKLLDAQQRLRKADFPVILLTNGDDWPSLGEALHLLHEWLDPRYLETNAFGPPSDEEADRPEFWRFWRALPPKGRIGIFFGAWYTRPIRERIESRKGQAKLDAELERIADFEKVLADDGALLVKFWFHTTKEALKKRMRAQERDRKERWRIRREERNILKYYHRGEMIVEGALRRTSTGEAPWTIIEATDFRHRNLAIGKTLIEAIHGRLNVPAPIPERRGAGAKPPAPNEHTILDTLDTAKKTPKPEYEREIERVQSRLGRLARRATERKVGTILLFEGWDAAGKGGLIRRFTAALDARNYRVIPIAAPTDEEKAQHYLWRFWRHLPRAGRVTIFDRSWYGRVLVERVEGFATEREWMRAYREINDFEEQLADSGIVLLKYWLHITQEEQLRRFEEREKTPYKMYKITEEDYRNRAKWNDYEAAANDMIGRTSTEYAPWRLIEANDKYYARVKALTICADRLKKALKD